MKRILAILLVFAISVSILASCNKDEKPAETTAADTAKTESPAIRESKAYPNALTVSAYSLLTNNEKIVYEAIAKLISSPEPSKAVTLNKSVATDTFDMVMDIFRANFATHSAVLEKITFTAKEKNITAVMIADDFDAEAFKNEYDAVNKKADEIISAIPLGLSDKEIVFELVDYLTANTEKLADGDPTTVYNVLIDGKADSEGFSKAFDLLLKKAGIPAFTVYGYKENHEYSYATNTSSTTYSFPEPRHYWNYVCLWNKWYELDLSRLHAFWFDSGELFLNIDELMLGSDLPYYFHRNGMDKMQIPMTEQWKNNISSYESADEVLKLIKNTSLEVLAKNSFEYALNIKFKNVYEAERFLRYDRTNIKDKTGTEYTLHLRKENGEADIINVTPVKVIDFDNISYTADAYKLDFCFKYDENADYRDQEVLTYFEPITVSFDIPEHWSGKEGVYYKYFDKSDYPGYITAMNVMRLIQTNVTLNEDNSRRLIGGELYMSEFFTGTTSNGNNYAYFLQKEPRGIEGYYSILIQLSPDYVIHLIIEDELAREDIIMKVIDSVTICK